MWSSMMGQQDHTVMLKQLKIFTINDHVSCVIDRKKVENEDQLFLLMLVLFVYTFIPSYL
uniref:Uncharacterized protein n=1 Tax=Arion vulgaris TaxID=1028688 RepID=A0A0B7ALC8_9EUPU